MTQFPKRISCVALVGALLVPALRADEVTYEVKDGVRYQVTRQVVQRPIYETRYEPREYTATREHYTTEMHDSHRTYQVPVTEQQWVPGYQRTWNPLAPPVLSYRLMPVTRWETRNETVRVPITKREVIPETRTQQVPVTTHRVVEDETVRRVAIGAASSDAPAVARGIGSSGRLQNDPPR